MSSPPGSGIVPAPSASSVPMETGQQPAPAASTTSPDHKEGRRRGLTIRLKLTLWYGCLFLLAGVLLITINYLMVRNSLSVAPEKARAAVAEQFGIPLQWLEWSLPAETPGMGFQPGDGKTQSGGQRQPFQLYLETEDGVFVSVPELLREAQNQLKDEALRQLWTRSLVALAIITVLTFGLAWFVAGRMLRPLHAITSTARRLSGSNLHERIDLTGPRDELKELADTFDDMLARLDAAFTAQKEFVANASHELRTPLTIIRTEIDVALSDPELSQAELQEMGAAITEAVDRSEKLIDGLLVLARTDSPFDLVDIDLAEIAEKEVDLASTAADAEGLRLELDLQPAPVKGERSLLERMAANLIENAVRHNVADGWFAVKTRVDGGLAVLEVTNGGPVISPDDASHLFDRFYRPDRSRSRKTGGFGLGLSIVKSVVAAHGGTVNLVAPPEGGLIVTVSLPLAAGRPPSHTLSSPEPPRGPDTGS